MSELPKIENRWGTVETPEQALEFFKDGKISVEELCLFFPKRAPNPGDKGFDLKEWIREVDTPDSPWSDGAIRDVSELYDRMLNRIRELEDYPDCWEGLKQILFMARGDGSRDDPERKGWMKAWDRVEDYIRVCERRKMVKGETGPSNPSMVKSS